MVNFIDFETHGTRQTAVEFAGPLDPANEVSASGRPTVSQLLWPQPIRN